MRRRLTLGLLGTAAAGGLAWLTRRATRGWDGELALPLHEFPAIGPDEFGSTLLVFLTSDSGWLGLMQPAYGMGYAGRLTDTDLRVGGAIADVLTGGPAGEYLWRVGEEDLMRRELEALVSLCRTVETRDRMAHFLKTGEPLRN